MNNFESIANEYLEAYRKRILLGKELRELKDESPEKKELTLKFKSAKLEEQSLLKKLDESRCPKGKGGHIFPHDLKICKNCGFEKK
jgi:hypothetical protein